MAGKAAEMLVYHEHHQLK